MTQTEALQQAKSGGAETILAHSVCLSLSCSYLGNQRKVYLDDMEIKDSKGAVLDKEQKEEIRATKQLLDRATLTPVTSLFSAAKAYLRGVATQGHRVFGPGTYLIPSTLVEQVDARLDQFAIDIKVAIDALVEEYPKLVEKRREELGPLFNESDYLPAAGVRAEFDFDWTYISFAAPEKLEEISHVIAQRAQQKYQSKLTIAAEEVVQQLREGALLVAQELVERLEPGPDGKPKRLMGTALRDLQEYVELLPHRNFQGDEQLPAALEKLTRLADGVDVRTLKDAPGVRSAILAAAQEASSALAQLVQEGPRRAIAFGGRLE